MPGTTVVMEFGRDVSYAVRMLRRAPGFAIVAILTLALSIGATSAIFSVVDGVLLKSLPFTDAERLYRVRTLYPDGTAYTALSAPDFESIREASRVFDRVEAYSATTFTWTGAGEPREVRAATVSRDLLGLLGLPVGVGRDFVPEEHAPGRGTAVVLDHGFWQREFGSDPSALGRTLSLSGRAYLVVGVMAPGPRLAADIDLYVPIEYGETFSASTAHGRRSEFLAVIGHARPGVSQAQIAQDLTHIGGELQTAFPDSNESLTFNALTVGELMIGEVRTPLLVLLGAVSLVLLVACVNVANLLLARASARQQELAVRAALGAGRGRLVRQLMTEALVLGLVGGAFGLVLAYVATRTLVAAQPADIPRLSEVHVNATVVSVTIAVSLLTSVWFGLLPALQAAGRRLTRALQEGGRGATGRAGHRVRAVLVVAELALAVVLLTGAGLLIRSFAEMMRVDPGFRTDQAMAFRVSLQGDAYANAAQIRGRVSEMEARVRALPGVTAVGSTSTLPLSGRGGLVDFAVEGAPPPPPNVNAEIGIVVVTPDYFRAIGAPLLRGRGLTQQDDDQAPRVAVVNAAAAAQWFPNQDPIGQRVRMSGTSYDVVGIVGDILHEDPGERAMPQIFTSYLQRATRTMRVVVRAAADPIALAPAVRQAVRALDQNLAVTNLARLEELLASSMARPRFYTTLLTLFAGVALALAAIGIFGVMSYTVAQRTREISIRMALGATRGQVVGMIVGRAIALACVGLVAGVLAAVASGRIIQSQLFGISVIDPLTLGGVAVVLALSAALAGFLPARRAATLDPIDALRQG